MNYTVEILNGQQSTKDNTNISDNGRVKDFLRRIFTVSNLPGRDLWETVQKIKKI